MRCLVCRSDDFTVLAGRARVAREMALRCAFFARRIDGNPDEKDRTEVAHDSNAQILICRKCGLLVRDEDVSPDFEHDHYTRRVMEEMYETYVDAWRVRATRYQPLLPRGAKVVEVGSYVGGFLEVAEEWGWNAVGVDVGHDTARFARAHGFAMCEDSLDHCGFRDGSVDGVFIWTCFEQVDDPRQLLTECRRIVRDDGLLVIRTPDAAFYRAREAELPSTFDDRHPAIVQLGYGNLLGFPHRFGFTPETLDRIAIEHGFHSAGHIRDTHIESIRARLTPEARQEKEAVQPGAWFEATYRAVESGSPTRSRRTSGPAT